MATPLVLVLPYMASIIGKKKGNKTYYYVATSGRVDGNPRITHQTYLGTAEHLARLVKDRTAPVPLEATARDCGLPAALWQAARRSGALDALLSVWPAPAKGPAIPHFLLLAAFHRICAPGPKTAAADWYRRSVLPDLWGFAPKRFSSQAFWDHFDKIDVSDSLREPRPDQLEQAQLALLRAFRERDLVSRCVLAYDTTNFPTWIATTNSRSALAQRGHNKQKRHDLRQIGLSYALDGEHGLSLGHHVYPGNVSDRDELPACLSRITRLLDGAGIPRQTVTLVLDKGSAALANTLELQASGLGWIAALPWGQAPAALRQRPLEQLEPLPGEPGVSVAGERTLVHGAEYLAVLRYSAGFASEQFHSVSVSLVKATQKLRALARQLSKPQDRHTEQGLRSRIQRWLQPNFVATVLSYELQRNPDRSWELRFAIDTSALHRLLKERFGRTTLVTNRHDWAPAQVAAAYQGQQHVERVFRGLKGGDWLHWGPLHPWTDSKIRVHAFYCLLGVSLLQYLHRQVRQAWPTLTMEGLQQELGQIQRIDLLYPRQGTKGPPRVATVNSKQTLTQQALADELQLDELLRPDRG